MNVAADCGDCGNPLAAFGGVSPSPRGRMQQTYTILPLEKGETPPKAARGFPQSPQSADDIHFFRYARKSILQLCRRKKSMNRL